MTLAMKKDIAPDPADIGLFCAHTVMPYTHGPDDFIKERRGCCHEKSSLTNHELYTYTVYGGIIQPDFQYMVVIRISPAIVI
jgi:hypothetical protein